MGFTQCGGWTYIHGEAIVPQEGGKRSWNIFTKDTGLAISKYQNRARNWHEINKDIKQLINDCTTCQRH